jgi:hypothetical protein
MKRALPFFQTLEKTHHRTMRHIPEVTGLQQLYSENLRSGKFYNTPKVHYLV